MKLGCGSAHSGKFEGYGEGIRKGTEYRPYSKEGMSRLATVPISEPCQQRVWGEAALHEATTAKNFQRLETNPIV